MSTQIQVRDADKENVLKVMREVLYPDADENAVNLVLAYCQATGIDPLLKPYHITYINCKDDRGNWKERPQILPSITLYRIKAHRSGDYLGHSEPEFGPEVTENLGGVNVTYPSWCKIIVYRKVGEKVGEFPAKEFWKENYATKARDSLTPNKMWLKRPYAQLAKCCEAQALRKAYTELVGSLPTIEEMEGKDFIQNYNSKKLESSSGKPELLIDRETGEIKGSPDVLVDAGTLSDLTIICSGYDEYGDRMKSFLERKGVSKISELSQKEAQKVLTEMLKDPKAYDLLIEKESEGAVS